MEAILWKGGTWGNDIRHVSLYEDYLLKTAEEFHPLIG